MNFRGIKKTSPLITHCKSVVEMGFQLNFDSRTSAFSTMPSFFSSLLVVEVKEREVGEIPVMKKAKGRPVPQIQRVAVEHPMGCQLGFPLRAEMQKLRPHPKKSELAF